MNEKSILEKYQKNCTQIGDLVYKNTLHDAAIKKLLQENSELEKLMIAIKQGTNEQNSSEISTEN